jgi:hypothetical protein
VSYIDWLVVCVCLTLVTVPRCVDAPEIFLDEMCLPYFFFVRVARACSDGVTSLRIIFIDVTCPVFFYLTWIIYFCELFFIKLFYFFVCVQFYFCMCEFFLDVKYFSRKFCARAIIFLFIFFL